jgi:hypothetical protein
MEDTATVIPRDEAWEGAGVSLPIGEPVTLVIDDERIRSLASAGADSAFIRQTRRGARNQTPRAIRNVLAPS